MTRQRLRQPGFAIIVALLLVLQLTQSSQAWTILLVGFGGMFVTAYFWSRTLGRNISVRRENNMGWVQVGSRIEEQITLSNNSLVPAPWIRFVDRSTLPDFDACRSGGIDAAFYDRWTVSATCGQRGLYYLGDAIIHTGDPFGIFEVTIDAPQRTPILVLPHAASLPELQIAPAGAFGDHRPRRNAVEHTIHASSVREYAHGDSTRLIHWPTTARMNKVYIRLLESAPEGNWWILLDLDREYMSGAGWEGVEEQSVAVAASLIDRALRSRKSVGLISNGMELAWLTPGKGEWQRWQAMQPLALAKPGPLGLDTVLERAEASLGRQDSLIIITASTRPDWLKSLVPLAHRGVTPTVILLDGSTSSGGSSTESTASVIRQRSIACHILPTGTIRMPESPPHERGKREWRVLSTGEIVLVQE